MRDLNGCAGAHENIAISTLFWLYAFISLCREKIKAPAIKTINFRDYLFVWPILFWAALAGVNVLS